MRDISVAPLGESHFQSPGADMVWPRLASAVRRQDRCVARQASVAAHAAALLQAMLSTITQPGERLSAPTSHRQPGFAPPAR
jgi:hypothetical protein